MPGLAAPLPQAAVGLAPGLGGAVDEERRAFIQAFGHPRPDGALLLIPLVDFVPFDDPRMVATTDWIRDELGWDGLVRRYDEDDSLPGR